jgi:hypothetical protein
LDCKCWYGTSSIKKRSLCFWKKTSFFAVFFVWNCFLVFRSVLTSALCLHSFLLIEILVRCDVDFQNVEKSLQCRLLRAQPFILLTPPDSPPQVLGDSQVVLCSVRIC